MAMFNRQSMQIIHYFVNKKHDGQYFDMITLNNSNISQTLIWITETSKQSISAIVHHYVQHKTMEGNIVFFSNISQTASHSDEQNKEQGPWTLGQQCGDCWGEGR